MSTLRSIGTGALNPARDLTAAWSRFWFQPTSTSTLAVVRIAFGLVTFIWTLTLIPDLRAFYSSGGIVPEQPPGAWTWGILQQSSSMTLVLVVFGLLLVGSVGLCLGFWTRLCSIIVFVALMSLERRNPWVLNSGDWLLRILAFYLILAPAGAALSVDRYRRDKDRFWVSPLRSPWALRLIQIQLSVVYLGSVWAKVRGTTWNDGTAVSYALRIGDFARVHVPVGIASSGLLTSFMTYGALATEFSIGVLVWNRRARPYVLAAGVLMHLMIDATMLVGFFSYEVFVAYLAFIPEDRLDVWLGRRLRRPDPLAQTGPLPAAEQEHQMVAERDRRPRIPAGGAGVGGLRPSRGRIQRREPRHHGVEPGA